MTVRASSNGTGAAAAGPLGTIGRMMVASLSSGLSGSLGAGAFIFQAGGGTQRETDGVRREAAVYAVFVLLVVVYTWPLAANPAAGAFFDTLAQFYQKAYLRWIDATTRRPDVRAARIAEVVDLLAAGVKERPRS